MSESKRGKYSCKTLLDKYEALKKLESGIAKKDVAAQYKVPPNRLSTWIKNKDKIVKAFEGGDSHSQRKQRAGNHDAVDKALYKWFTKVREEGVPISGGILKEKASKYARELGIENFKASNSWLDRWKGRHDIVFKTVSGEAKSCTADMTASWEETILPTILTNYQLRDIFNADEFGLFYKALPEKSLHLKSEKCIGGKHNKIRLTGLAAANAEGEKLPMFVIGKSVKPRCFTGVINLPCRHRAQKKSWMDSSLFEEWIREQDRKFERQGRKIALIVDNCLAHPQISNLKAIHLVFLPPNSTSKTQPMDQGVIRATKAYYRQGCVKKFIAAVDNNKPLPNLSILDAMAILTEAWGRVSEQTICNCFRKAGIGNQAQQSALNDDDDPFKILLEDIGALRERSPELVPDEVSAEDVVDTDRGVLTSDTGSLSDEDILAEFREENEMEVDDGNDGNEDEQQEETPKRPTKSEVHQAIETLSRYSLFAVEGAEIRRQTSQLSFTIDKSLRKNQKQQNIQRFFNATVSADLSDI